MLGGRKNGSKLGSLQRNPLSLGLGRTTPSAPNQPKKRPYDLVSSWDFDGGEERYWEAQQKETMRRTMRGVAFVWFPRQV